jgi:hypothetical protein
VPELSLIERIERAKTAAVLDEIARWVEDDHAISLLNGADVLSRRAVARALREEATR